MGLKENTNSTGEAPEETTEETESETVEVVETDWKAEAEKYKALAVKHELRSKENFKKAQLADELTEKLTKFETSFTEVQNENLNLKKKVVGVKFGLPDKVIHSLSGATQEDLEKEAQEWAELFKGKTPEAPETKKPKPLPTQGQEDGASSAPTKARTREEFLLLKQAKQNQ